MLFLYYTGADNCGYEQKDPQKSLGGVVSTTRIPKDVLNNLFPDVSNYSIQKGTNDIKCIAVKNEASMPVNDVTIFIDSTDTTCDYELAAVAPTINECEEAEFEKIGNSESSPYYAEFMNVTGSENAINIGSIAEGAVIGVWIKRKFKTDIINDPCSNTEVDNPTKTETMKLNVSWS